MNFENNWQVEEGRGQTKTTFTGAVYFLKEHNVVFIFNYFLTKSEVFTGKLSQRLRPCRIDNAMSRSICQLFAIFFFCLFLQTCNRAVGQPCSQGFSLEGGRGKAPGTRLAVGITGG